MNEYDPKLFVHPRWQKFYDQGLRTCEGKSAPHFAEANTLLLTTHTQLGHSSSLSILEFGSNTGSLCYEIMHKHKDHIKSYTLVDEDKLLSQAIPKLRRHKTKLKFCNIPDTNDCLGQPYNLLIAFGCIEETTDHFRDFLYNRIFPNVEEIFLVIGQNDDPTCWGKNFDDKLLYKVFNDNFEQVDEPALVGYMGKHRCIYHHHAVGNKTLLNNQEWIEHYA